MWFIVIVLIAMFCCRELGWFFSKSFLYVVPGFAAFLFCLLWGTLLAFSLRLAINDFHPGTILKVIGYGAGAYAAIPNYGLISESTIPTESLPRHNLLKAVPFWSFVAASIVAAYVV